MGDRLKICTVIGFPNGYNTTAVKEFETKDALKKGADEIDMVINLGWVKDGRFDLVEKEIRTLKDACGGNVLKVIIESCLLTEEEKVKMCEVVTNSGADFIKTSTGFSTSGATFADVVQGACRSTGENQGSRRYFFFCRCRKICRTGRRQTGHQPSGKDYEAE